MIDKLKNNIIIVALAAFVVVSFIFLAFAGQRQQDYNYQKNWWAIYFSDPKSHDLNFTVENHSTTTSFHWSASHSKDKPFKEGDMEIKKGESQAVVLDIGEPEDKKITIRVSDGDKAKEIYKDFRK